MRVLEIYGKNNPTMPQWRNDRGAEGGGRGGGQLPPGAAGKGAQNRGRKIASSTRPQKFDAI